MSYAPAFVHIAARQRINGPELRARIRDEPVEEGAEPFELRDRDVLKYALLYERGAFLVRHSWLPLRADDQYRSHVAIDLPEGTLQPTKSLRRSFDHLVGDG